ncbi:hypothetical protein OS493_039145, partial [Desmophyllum pertusum]
MRRMRLNRASVNVQGESSSAVMRLHCFFMASITSAELTSSVSGGNENQTRDCVGNLLKECVPPPKAYASLCQENQHKLTVSLCTKTYKNM